MSESLQIWNRRAKRMDIETVYGEKPMRLVYTTGPGRALADTVLARPWLSKLYGSFQDSPLSRGKIAPFVDKFGVPMQEYEERPFSSFNDFFTRKFRPGQREFASEPGVLPAFCEGRYLAFDSVAADEALPVKGAWLRVGDLLEREKWVRLFDGGPAYIARLCPVDYHRFHFPDSGRKVERYPLHGPLHSVNPMALAAKPSILFTNERAVTILSTENFGHLAYVEVGAMMVGKIVDTYSGLEFNRGDEKGYFLFGGSTVILVGEKGRWTPDFDLLGKSAEGVESLVRLGEPIGSALT